MTSTQRKLAATLLSVGVGAAAAVAALAIADASTTSGLAPRKTDSLKPRAALSGAQNEQRLDSKTKAELSAFGRRLARCLATRGVEIGQPRAVRNEIVIRIRAGGGQASDPTALATQMIACDQKLGKPPPGTSVTIDREAVQKGRGAIRLFKPRTCPLAAAPIKAPQ